MKLRLPYSTLFALLFAVMGVMLLVENVKGQSCTPKIRTYANFQGSYLEGLGLLGSPTIIGNIANPGNAVNGNVKEASTLSIGLGLAGLATVTQYLEFTTDGTHINKRLIPANTPVRIKFTLPKEVLGLLSGIEIGTFTNMTSVSASWPFLLGAGHSGGFNSNNKVPAYSGASLLNLLSGAGDFEITISPAAAYNGAYVKLSGDGLALALTADVYHAYILEDAPNTTVCNSAVDVLAGVRAGTAVGGIANATGQVNDKWFAIDNDISTYAEMNLGASVLSEVYHTTIFKSEAQPGDVVRMVIEKPGNGLLNLSILSGFTIQLYNGQQEVGDPLTSTSTGLLSLNLLPGDPVGSNRRELLIAIPQTDGAYDRVEIKMGGVADVDLTTGLRIYDIKRIIKPTLLIDGSQVASKDVCFGNTASLSVSETQYCTTYNWYKTAVGGTAVHTGTTAYTPLASSLTVGDNIFYLEATRTNCTETSGRIPVKIIVNALPSAGTITGNAGVCVGQTTSLTNVITGGVWTSSDETKATVDATGTVTGVAVGTATITYTVTDLGTGCTNFTTLLVTINALPTVNPITGNASLCVGNNITLANTTPGGIWASSNPTSATINSSGLVTGLAAGQTIITYTVTSNGCSTPAIRVIDINPLPTASISGTTTVCQGASSPTVTFTGASGTAPYTFTYNVNGGSNTTITTGSGNAVSLTVPTTSSGTFNYNLISVKDNSSTQCAQSQSGTAIIIINPKPPTPHVAIE